MSYKFNPFTGTFDEVIDDHGALTGLADDDHTQYTENANNLSDLASAATARTNLEVLSQDEAELWSLFVGDF